jgi:hypothetical protein
MKRIILTAFAILSVICSFGQKKFGIKIYQNTDIFETQYYVGNGEMMKFDIVNFDRFSFALNIDSKKRFTHEIEVLIPEVEKPLVKVRFPVNYEFGRSPAFEGRVSSYSLRYEFTKTLSKNTKGFSFDCGIAINPFFVLIEYLQPGGTHSFGSRRFHGFSLNAVPRMKYKLNDRLTIDLNMPLKIYDLYKGYASYILPSNPKRNSDFYTSSFFEDVYTIRLGLMYKFNM